MKSKGLVCVKHEALFVCVLFCSAGITPAALEASSTTTRIRAGDPSRGKMLTGCFWYVSIPCPDRFFLLPPFKLLSHSHPHLPSWKVVPPTLVCSCVSWSIMNTKKKLFCILSLRATRWQLFPVFEWQWRAEKRLRWLYKTWLTEVSLHQHDVYFLLTSTCVPNSSVFLSPVVVPAWGPSISRCLSFLLHSDKVDGCRSVERK